jgi:hypothetical protein
MAPLKTVERLAQAARRERLPGMDVTAGVLAAVQKHGTPELALWPFALGSATAAAVVFPFATAAWSSAWGQLLSGLFDPLHMVIL